MTKQEIESKITEKRQNDGCMTPCQNPEMIQKKKSFSKCFSDHTEQLLPLSTLLKNQVKLTKQEFKSKNY